MEELDLGILLGVRIFSDFAANEVGWVADKMSIRTIPIHTMVCGEGELGGEFFIILSGTVQVSKKDDNKKEHEITRLSKGSCFGEMALVDTLPRSASVYAMEETKLAVLSQDSLFRLKEENIDVYSHILLNLAKEFSRRLRSMDNKYIKMLGFFF